MSDVDKEMLLNSNSAVSKLNKTKLPPQWIQCDLRTIDMRVLGKFSVIMAGTALLSALMANNFAYFILKKYKTIKSKTNKRCLYQIN